MNRINSYNELHIWQQALDLVTDVFAVTANFPEQESCGLINQMNRASVAIPCNIAEGWGRESTKSYAHFLKISKGSVMELETLLQISYKLNLINLEQLDRLRFKTVEMSRMITIILKKTKRNPLKNN